MRAEGSSFYDLWFSCAGVIRVQILLAALVLDQRHPLGDERCWPFSLIIGFAAALLLYAFAYSLDACRRRRRLAMLSPEQAAELPKAVKIGGSKSSMPSFVEETWTSSYLGKSTE